jgi:hypothetical protein
VGAGHDSSRCNDEGTIFAVCLLNIGNLDQQGRSIRRPMSAGLDA